jgi:nitrous oxidase accessory protein NosD
MLMLLLIDTFMFASSIHPAETEPTTIVVPYDYSSIQGAINAARPGDTIFVGAGIYDENLTIEPWISNVTLIGESCLSTVINGSLSSYAQCGITVKNFEIKGRLTFSCGSVGTALAQEIHIYNNIIRSGVVLHVWYSTVEDNLIEGGLFLRGGHHLCAMLNLVRNNTLLDSGISMDVADGWGCMENTITCNTIINASTGILELGQPFVTGPICYNNSITNNHIINCGTGINSSIAYFDRLTKIFENTLENNGYGIFLENVTRMSIYPNNFVNNKIQAYTNFSYNNTWDNGYPSGGNYWSDYNGADVYHGPSQNLTGSDGIGDTPYVIDSNNRDNYPLMGPWTLTPRCVTATVYVDPSTLNLKSTGKWVTAYIELPTGYNVSNINVATIRLNGTIPVDEKAPTAIDDYNNGGIPHLMVEFNMTAVESYIYSQAILYGDVDPAHTVFYVSLPVSLTITGGLADGTVFTGTTVVSVNYFDAGIAGGGGPPPRPQ